MVSQPPSAGNYKTKSSTGFPREFSPDLSSTKAATTEQIKTKQQLINAEVQTLEVINLKQIKKP
jgi:hypothetical protein